MEHLDDGLRDEIRREICSSRPHSGALPVDLERRAMDEQEFRKFVESRVALVLTSRMTVAQMQTTVDDIVEQWQKDKTEEYELGRMDERSLQYTIEMQKEQKQQ